jgi:hypothetical protein
MNDTTQNYDVIEPKIKEDNLVQLSVKAEIDTQIATAKQYPRSIKQFMNNALQMVTLNEAVAESCNYGLPRGGKIITGPSARFAEIIYSAWGNARAGARVVHEDGRFITSQGVCHDLQSNTMITMEVKRRITDKNGKTFADDMIGVTGNAAASIALRNAILRAIPKAFWEPLYQESRKVAMGNSKTLATRRADALAVMQKFGVSLEMILAKFEIKGVEDITLEHLADLNACKNSIKDGETTVEALFDIPKPAAEGKGNEGVKDKLKKNAAKKEPEKAEKVDPETGEVTQEPEKPEAKKKEPTAATFNAALIPVYGLPNDKTQTDYGRWKKEFKERCEAAPSLEQIGLLFKNNVRILNQFKDREPTVYDECQSIYDECLVLLGANQ